MTNQKKKSDKPLSQEQLNQLWEKALKEEQRKSTRAEELLNEGYRPFQEVFDTLNMSQGHRSGYLSKLKAEGWSCEKARWNGASQNFIRPPLE